MSQDSLTILKQGRDKRERRYLIVLAILVFLIIILSILMLAIGSINYPLSDVIKVLLGQNIEKVSFAINNVRLPRMIAGIFSGICFGVAGSVFQTMLRNPLANPNIIGITSGSSAGAVFCILILQASNSIVFLVSIISGLLTTIIIYFLAVISKFSIKKIILIGIGMQAMLSSLISYFLLIGAENDLATAIRWMSGSLNGLQIERLIPLIVSVIIFLPIILIFSKSLSILELGEETAKSLGVNTNIVRLILIICSVILVAVATGTTGPIAFVAFLSGPISKRLVGNGKSSVLASALFGIVLVLSADLIGQFAFDTRFPVGVITGILGAPYLIFLLIRMNKKGEL